MAKPTPNANPADADGPPAILSGTPFFPLGPPTWPTPQPALTELINHLFAAGNWAYPRGPYHQKLTQSLEEYFSRPDEPAQVELVCSGTAAIELALRSIPLQPGDQVIMSAYDFPGNLANIINLGARPVLVDINGPSNDAATSPLAINVDAVAAAITPATKAILVSHLHGNLNQMLALSELANQHGITLIEDACQVPGANMLDATGRLMPAGTVGQLSVLSFGGSKLLPAGTGGAIIARDALRHQRARLYQHRTSQAYPLGELQAAIAHFHWQGLCDQNNDRAQQASKLRTELARFDFLRPAWPMSSPQRQVESKSPDHATANSDSVASATCQPVFYKLPFWYDAQVLDLPRDAFVAALRAEGISFSPGFRCLNKLAARARFDQPEPTPHADAASQSLIMLHHPILLADDNTLSLIPTAIARIARHADRIPKSAKFQEAWERD